MSNYNYLDTRPKLIQEETTWAWCSSYLQDGGLLSIETGGIRAMFFCRYVAEDDEADFKASSGMKIQSQNVAQR
jgi:hypothetical protein